MIVWDVRKEKILSKLSKIAGSYEIQHRYSANLFGFLDVLLGMATGIITTSTGILLAVPPEGEKCSYSKDKGYVTVLLISSVLIFIQQYMAFSKTAFESTVASKKFKILHIKAVTQLALSRDDRLGAQDYLISLSESINENILNCPTINFIVNEFYTRYKPEDAEDILLESIVVEDRTDYLSFDE